MVTRPRQAKRWVGLDLGQQSIKLVEVEQGPEGLRLVKHLIQELPAAPDGQPVDRVGWLQSAAKEFDIPELHAALSGSEVALRRIHVPLMSRAEVPEAARWQIKDQVPFAVQDACLDVQLIGEVWEKDIKKQDLLVGAASQPAVQSLITEIERAGAHVASVSPSGWALWRCVTALASDARQGSIAVVHLGRTATEVLIGKEGQLRVVRELPLGGASMTESLIGVVGSERGEVAIDRPRAEALKRLYGVLPQAPEGVTEDGVPLSHLAALMRPVLERLLTELSRVLDFYKVQVEETGVSRVLVCGAGATLKQLPEFLAEGLGLPVVIFNPLRSLPAASPVLDPEAAAAETGPSLAVALGMALDHGQGINLVPRSNRTMLFARSGGVGPSVWRWAAGALLAGAVAFQAAAGVAQWRLRSLERRWADVEPAYTRSIAMTSTRAALERMTQSVERFSAQEPVWDGVFKAVAEAMPPTLQLDELHVVPRRIHLKGHGVAGTAGDGSIARLLDAINASAFFSEAELMSSELHAGGQGQTSFDLEASLE